MNPKSRVGLMHILLSLSRLANRSSNSSSPDIWMRTDNSSCEISLSSFKSSVSNLQTSRLGSTCVGKGLLSFLVYRVKHSHIHLFVALDISLFIRPYCSPRKFFQIINIIFENVQVMKNK